MHNFYLKQSISTLRCCYFYLSRRLKYILRVIPWSTCNNGGSHDDQVSQGSYSPRFFLYCFAFKLKNNDCLSLNEMCCVLGWMNEYALKTMFKGTVQPKMIIQSLSIHPPIIYSTPCWWSFHGFMEEETLPDLPLTWTCVDNDWIVIFEWTLVLLIDRVSWSL